MREQRASSLSGVGRLAETRLEATVEKMKVGLGMDLRSSEKLGFKVSHLDLGEIQIHACRVEVWWR